MSNEIVSLRPYRPVGLSRPRIMGVLNMTPDSFSDGGLFTQIDAAIARGAELVAAGAQLIDVGGESTRPGAERLPVEEEQRRVLPVIEALTDRGIPVSIDTMNASTALAAAERGVVLINDVSGGLADEGMPRVAAETGLHFVAMHWRGPSKTMDENSVYENVLKDVRNELKNRVAELIINGVRPDRIILDPGIGFAKTTVHNWKLLSNLAALETIGYPILIGASRKRFLGTLLPKEAPTTDRDPATATISALAAQAGVWGIRVHDVAGTKAALDVWEAMQP
ncbi:dihydropteroate synthase [Glaciihabitans sp. UYNi722]|uniref:dihydropteroate synthase n=1 Tax=Glaciihabitans sp. UYNi722 TaxID=3156344 RepID=UPI0033982499